MAHAHTLVFKCTTHCIPYQVAVFCTSLATKGLPIDPKRETSKPSTNLHVLGPWMIQQKMYQKGSGGFVFPLIRTLPSFWARLFHVFIVSLDSRLSQRASFVKRISLKLWPSQVLVKPPLYSSKCALVNSLLSAL